MASQPLTGEQMKFCPQCISDAPYFALVMMEYIQTNEHNFWTCSGPRCSSIRKHLKQAHPDDWALLLLTWED